MDKQTIALAAASPGAGYVCFGYFPCFSPSPALTQNLHPLPPAGLGKRCSQPDPECAPFTSQPTKPPPGTAQTQLGPRTPVLSEPESGHRGLAVPGTDFENVENCRKLAPASPSAPSFQSHRAGRQPLKEQPTRTGDASPIARDWSSRGGHLDGFHSTLVGVPPSQSISSMESRGSGAYAGARVPFCGKTTPGGGGLAYNQGGGGAAAVATEAANQVRDATR